MFSNTKIERGLWKKGYKLIAGLDEVGYGAWAGPVVAGVVVWQPKKKIYKIRDSKILTAKVREKLAKKIKKEAVGWAVGEASVEEIAEKGLGQARNLAMIRALERLEFVPDYLLIDAVKLCWKDVDFKAIIKGDSRSISIGAASIVAKVYRDNLMEKLDGAYSKYGFAKHKGYGTKYHQEMMRRYGFSGQHRMNYNLKFLGNI